MSNIEKHISKDGYPLYSVNINGGGNYLGDIDNYYNDIKELLDSIDELFFDAIVLIFGIDGGSYIEKLESQICVKNKVIIIEPNLELFQLHENNIKNENIKLIPYDENIISEILEENINFKNVNRIVVHCFGKYQEIYKDEYEKFTEILDDKYYKAITTIDIFTRLRKMFFENALLNLPEIQNSTPLNTYININENKPAIVVSAGPSLDKNIETLIKYKDILDQFFIIVGNRTLPALVENNIIPNLVVSLDPKEEIYEMMKDYLDMEVPLAFYEHSNSDLVRQYKGDKIYIADIFPRVIDELKGCIGSYIGGSVAHCCIDFARIMGCNPIILSGQDCALTYNKNYSDNANLGIESDMAFKSQLWDNDVFGNKVKTTPTLNFFKKRIEEYIIMVKERLEIEFINVSYGADIIGAPHMDLEQVILSQSLERKISKLEVNKCIKLDLDKIIDSIYEYICYFIEESDKCINICKELEIEEELPSLLDVGEDDERLHKFLYVMNTLNQFEQNKKNIFINAYINKFLFEVRQNYFEMLALDYTKLTSDFKYQSTAFKNYFTDLKSMFMEVKEIFEITVAKLK